MPYHPDAGRSTEIADSPVFTKTTRTQERTDSADPDDATNARSAAHTGAGDGARVTGPHHGYDRDGRLDHRYWRCERCGLETTDPRIRKGCFRCGAGGEATVTEGDDAE